MPILLIANMNSQADIFSERNLEEVKDKPYF